MKKIIFTISLVTSFIMADGQWTNTYNGQGDFSDVFNSIKVDASGNTYQSGYSINPDLSKDILLIKLNNAGDTSWTRVFNGPGNGPDEAIAMTLDNDNNIILTGYQKGSGTGYDIITLKYAGNGELLWQASYNYTSNEFDQSNAVITDADGNIYIAGQSDKDETVNNNDDFLIIKYNSTGIQQWAKRTNGLGNSTDRPSAITLNTENDVVVTGRSFNGNDDDYFTVKYDGSTGTELWKKYFDRTHNDRATAIVCNTANNRIYITGRSTNGDNYDYATVCYDNAGIEIWQSIFDYVDDDRATHIGLDNSGNIYVTGQSDINASAIGINYDILTVKYNSLGVQQFAQSYGGDATGDDIPSGLQFDNSGNIIICGSTDMDASAAIKNDYVVLKYNTAGTLQWSTTFDGSGTNDNAKSLAVDGTGNIYVAGYSEAVPNKDAATIKLNNAGNLQWDYTYNGIGDNADNVHAIKKDNSNNTYLAGYTFGYEQDRNFLLMKIGASGTMQWQRFINGSSNTQSTDDAIALQLDNAGNIYAAGFVKNSGTGYDMMIVKYSTTGDSLWSFNYNYTLANETDKAIALELDADNNLYVVGRSDQDPTIVSNDDIVTLKVSSAGNLLWEKRYNGAGNSNDNVKALYVTSSGNIYVTGKTTVAGQSDIILLKYNSAGVQQWVKTFDRSNGNDEAIALWIDASENIYIGAETTSANDDLDVTILCYTNSGTLSWEKHYDSGLQGNDETKSLHADNEGNLIIAATTAPDTALLTLNGDITVLKFDNTGELLWEQTFENELNDDASEATIDANNNIIITGQTDNGTAGYTNYDYLTLQYLPDGTLYTTETYNGADNLSDVPNTLMAFENAIYVTGGSYGTASQRDIVTILYGTTPESVENIQDNQMQFTVFPNPATTQFEINTLNNELGSDLSVRFQLFDIQGRLLIEIPETVSPTINCSQLPRGIYVLNAVMNGEILSTQKIILN